MATVQGIREKCHLPIYDSVSVEGAQQLRDVEPTSTLKFFVNVQNKTKLETNLQSASLLPHYNTFEARAMRVVISDLPPEFPAEITMSEPGFDVTYSDDEPVLVDETGVVVEPLGSGETGQRFTVTADLDLGLDRVMELLAEARASDLGTTVVDVIEEGITLHALDENLVENEEVEVDAEDVFANFGGIDITVADLELLLEQLDDKQLPPKEQLKPNNGSGTIIGKLVYNTVTTLYVGEKIMIQMPTWFFPAGAGPYSENSSLTTHGEPSPMATFRFAEPIFIDKQQNFRVELEVPDTDTLKEIQRIYGPLNIWVVLDGYMTRDVQ